MHITCTKHRSIHGAVLKNSEKGRKIFLNYMECTEQDKN